jgi:hypothetical protein
MSGRTYFSAASQLCASQLRQLTTRSSGALRNLKAAHFVVLRKQALDLFLLELLGYSLLVS